MAPVDLAIDAPAVRRQLVTFLRAYARGAGADGFVLGLSGGVDSAVCAALAAEAVGARQVLGLVMPHESSDPRDAEDARLVVNALGVESRRVDVTPIVRAVQDAVDVPALAEAGPKASAVNNVKARARMIVNYAHANASNRLVLGTGNKSELLTGYFTKYGDGGADVYPIGDLYKTQVWELARDLDLPARVVEKPPSAGLYEGQTDEDELGLPYADLDRVLHGFESQLAPEDVAARTGMDVKVVRGVEARLIASEHKRTSLVVPKIGFRTPGLDWREPRQRAPSPPAAEVGRR